MNAKQKVWLRSLIIVGIFFGLIFAWNFVSNMGMKKFFASMPEPPVTVSATQAQATTLQPTLNAVGNLIAISGINVPTEVGGIVQSIPVQAGQEVPAGTPLVILDPNVEQADFDNSQAALALAKTDYARQESLFKSRAISKSVLDTAKATYDQANALNNKNKTLLDKKTIRAAFAGRVGIVNISVGQYLAPGTTLMNLQSLDPIHANFYVPEQALQDIKVGQTVDLKVDVAPLETFKGTITGIDSAVDNQSRNVLVQATIANPNKKLLPGMFANVAVQLPSKVNVVVVPQTAVDYSSEGIGIYVLSGDPKKGYTADKKSVVLGEYHGNNVEILGDTIKPGTLVVTAGQIKLHGGQTIFVKGRGPGVKAAS